MTSFWGFNTTVMVTIFLSQVIHALSITNERNLCIQGWKKLQSCARSKMYLTLWTMPMVCSHQSACTSFSRYVLTWPEGDCLTCPSEGYYQWEEVGSRGGKVGLEIKPRKGSLTWEGILWVLKFEFCGSLCGSRKYPYPSHGSCFGLNQLPPTPPYFTSLEIPQSLIHCWYNWP